MNTTITVQRYMVFMIIVGHWFCGIPVIGQCVFDRNLLEKLSHHRDRFAIGLR